MSLDNYGTLKGRVIEYKLGTGDNPHFQILINDETDLHRIAVNVKSQATPSEVLYLIDEDFNHPITEVIKDFSYGFHHLDRGLDYIRGNLFNPEKVVPLPFDIPGPDNDLNEKIQNLVNKVQAEEGDVYAFGQKWGPEKDKRDKYFGFKPGNGIHDIHMNQGNFGRWMSDNGIYQDGGLLFYLPQSHKWTGVFLAFQSQSWHTDDTSGNPLGDNEYHDQYSFASIKILAALINPLGADQGQERIILFNPTSQSINLEGWSLLDQSKNKYYLKGESLASGAIMDITLPADSIYLGNSGGLISLLNREGIKIHGVKYAKNDIPSSGSYLLF